VTDYTDKSFMIDTKSVCAKMEKDRNSRFEWLIFEEMFQQNRGKIPLLKSVSPMTPICIALFAGHLKPDLVLPSKQSRVRDLAMGTEHESHSDSDYEDIRSDLVRSVLDWKNVNLKMESTDQQIVSGILRLREDWNSLFESRLQPQRYKPKDADELIIKTLKDILMKEGMKKYRTYIHKKFCFKLLCFCLF
jgi:hypothetical protein